MECSRAFLGTLVLEDLFFSFLFFFSLRTPLPIAPPAPPPPQKKMENPFASNNEDGINLHTTHLASTILSNQRTDFIQEEEDNFRRREAEEARAKAEAEARAKAEREAQERVVQRLQEGQRGRRVSVSVGAGDGVSKAQQRLKELALKKKNFKSRRVSMDRKVRLESDLTSPDAAPDDAEEVGPKLRALRERLGRSHNSASTVATGTSSTVTSAAVAEAAEADAAAGAAPGTPKEAVGEDVFVYRAPL